MQARVEFVPDLPVADAVYDQTCRANFRTASRCPKYTHDDSTIKQLKRPYDSAQAFKKVILYLELNDKEQITINDLIRKMEEYLIGTGNTAYVLTHMKYQIKKQFAENTLLQKLMAN